MIRKREGILEIFFTTLGFFFKFITVLLLQKYNQKLEFKRYLEDPKGKY